MGTTPAIPDRPACLDLRAPPPLALEVRYLPQVALDTGRLVGFEALTRGRHPTWGTVPPPVFPGVTERRGIVEELGRWTLRIALADAARWRVPPQGRALRVAVDVTAAQLHAALAPEVAAALAATGVAPDRLTLEVGVRALATDLPLAEAVLDDLAALGVRLAVDDCGSGHLSLVQLRRLPVDEIKIDPSFVDGIGTVADDTAFVAAVTALAHSVGLDVVAEGVEDDVQRAELERLGVDVAQGDLFGPPRTSAQVDALGDGDHEVAVAPTAGTTPTSGDRSPTS